MVNIDTKIEADILTLKVVGEVDASSSINLDNAINNAIKEGHKKILIDGEGMNYISSAGLGVFMSYLQDFEKHNIKMVLYGLNEKVLNVFKILGLDQLISIAESESEAKVLMND
ncbi:MAG: STAS domain-containing protein [Bacteroidetes bacterium]|nr:STAS domain-containing protein [Bacteroidota bacterium]MCH8232527.1 STAS domain-containing protein [Bacteroidota bacterium]